MEQGCVLRKSGCSRRARRSRRHDAHRRPRRAPDPARSAARGRQCASLARRAGPRVCARGTLLRGRILRALRGLLERAGAEWPEGASVILNGVSSCAVTPPSVVIEPRRSYSLRLGELWAYRELLYFLMWRDIKVRYKQTALGAAWAVLQPLLLMVVFTIFLGQLKGVGPPGIPYPIFSFAALVPWTFFSVRWRPEQTAWLAVRTGVEDLLPAAADAARVHLCSFLLDFVDQLRGLADSDGGVQLRTVWSNRPVACVHALRRGRRRRCRTPARCAQRPLPRRSLRDPVPGSAVAVRDARCVSVLGRRIAISMDLRAQSNGRGYRRISRGADRDGGHTPRGLRDLDDVDDRDDALWSSSTSGASSARSPTSSDGRRHPDNRPVEALHDRKCGRRLQPSHRGHHRRCRPSLRVGDPASVSRRRRASSGRSTTCPSRSKRARSSGSSAGTARARRRC